MLLRGLFPALMSALVLCISLAARPAWAEEKTALPSGEAEANRDLGNARRMVRSGNNSQAIPLLLKILTDAPDTPAAVDAHYELGLAYESIQDVRNAQLQLKEYLDHAPQGEFADDARKHAAALQLPGHRRGWVPAT